MARQMVPPVRFCWECGRKLRGRHHVLAKVHGHERVLHKKCFDDLEKNQEVEISEITRS